MDSTSIISPSPSRVLRLLSLMLIFYASRASTISKSRRNFLLYQVCSQSEGTHHGMHYSVLENIKSFVQYGHLSEARQLANECIALLHLSKQKLDISSTGVLNGGSVSFKNKSPNFSSLVECCPPTDEIIETYKSAVDDLFNEKKDFVGFIVDSLHQRTKDDASFGKAEMLSSEACWDGRKIVDETADLVSIPTFGIVSDNSIGIFDSNIVSHGSMVIDRWNECCSFFGSNSYNSMLLNHDKNPLSMELRSQQSQLPAMCFDTADEHSLLCCELSDGSDNHLILPALREPWVKVRLDFRVKEGNNIELLEIEQDGSLRMYDVSGVLWPAGYLLGLCLSDPISCGVPEVMNAIRIASLNDRAFPVAVELGAGVGFPSIVLAKSMKYHKKEKEEKNHVCRESNLCGDNFHSGAIVATDVSTASLGLVAANAHHNGVGDVIDIMAANNTDAHSLSLLHQRFFLLGEDGYNQDGFNLIFGSSLQGLFDGTSQHGAALWHSLDILLSKNNPDAVVLLSHVRSGNERIDIPPTLQLAGDGTALFECVRRIQGDRFGMFTRDGHASDFEILLLRRRRRQL